MMNRPYVAASAMPGSAATSSSLARADAALIRALLLRDGSSSFIEATSPNGSSSRRGSGVRRSRASASNAPASAKSASVRPPAEWLVSDSLTLFQPWTRMSGWWLAVLGHLGDAVDEARSRRRSPRSSQSRTISSPSRVHADPQPGRDFLVAEQLCHIVSVECCAELPYTSRERCESSASSRRATEMLFALGLGDELIARHP